MYIHTPLHVLLSQNNVHNAQILLQYDANISDKDRRALVFCKDKDKEIFLKIVDDIMLLNVKN